MNTNTGKVLYHEMVTKGMSIIWIQREYGVSCHYVIRKVHEYMTYLIEQGKIK